MTGRKAMVVEPENGGGDKQRGDIEDEEHDVKMKWKSCLQLLVDHLQIDRKSSIHRQIVFQRAMPFEMKSSFANPF